MDAQDLQSKSLGTRFGPWFILQSLFEKKEEEIGLFIKRKEMIIHY